MLTWNLQGLWVLFTLFGALTILTSVNNTSIAFIDIIGILIWIVGFIIEIISDKQKSVFKNKKENKGRFIQIGLWKYSRHPNYFGELLIYTGFLLLTIESNFWWVPILILGAFVLSIWIPGMVRIDKSLSRFADFKE